MSSEFKITEWSDNRFSFSLSLPVHTETANSKAVRGRIQGFQLDGLGA